MIGLRSLVLNANYMPISLFPLHTIPVEDAVTRVFNGTCHVVESYDRKILSSSVDMGWPSIIARSEHAKLKDLVRMRRESLFYRDHGLCAYCEKPITISGLTYDHVIPQSKGGSSDWENIVCACGLCNTKKGNSMPVGIWKPKFAPYKPNYYQLLKARKKFPIVIDHESWVDYLGNWESDVIIKGRAAA
tara:strand:- start:241 stop:807 length:567 start_codon:yes stop_codon:yes gene_type:complete